MRGLLIEEEAAVAYHLGEESNDDGISIKVNEIVTLIGGGGCDSIRHYTLYTL